jgi:hypothetical protein
MFPVIEVGANLGDWNCGRSGTPARVSLCVARISGKR